MASVMQMTMSLGSATSSFIKSFNVPKASPSRPSAAPLVIEAAHKKGAGSTKNGRDSQSKRLGVKVYGEQAVKAGGIIIRQRGSTWKAGKNTFLGKDFTLHAKIDGIVRFQKNRSDKKKQKINVIPHDPPLVDA